jgi:hypothetical protein
VISVGADFFETEISVISVGAEFFPKLKFETMVMMTPS